MANELVYQPEGESAMIPADAGALSVHAEQAAAYAEIQIDRMMARRFPRSEKQAWSDLMEACKRETVARSSEYSYPRGDVQVTGKSVYLARVAARIWGNIQWGFRITRDDAEEMSIEGFAIDLQTGAKATFPRRFKKLVQRKVKDQETGRQVTRWVKPDERDLAEYVSKHGAIATRNCILQILPPDYLEDAIAQCRKTIKEGIKDAAGESKRLILEFRKMGVTVEMLNKYVGSEEWGLDDIADLIGVWNSIKDGNSTKDEYFQFDSPAETKEKASKIKQDLASTAQRLKQKAEPATQGAQADSPTPAPAGPIADPTPEQLEKGELFG